MKLDASGAVQWSNVYYGTNWLSGAAGSSPYPIFQTADGGFVLSGTVQARSYPFENLFFLLTLDAQGNIVWQKGYGGVNGGYDHTSEQGGAVATADGGYVLAGESNVFQQAVNGWIVKTDGSGNILWQKSYSGLTSYAGNVFNGIIQTSDGGFAATGESWSPDLTYGGPGLWLVKVDPNGNIGTCSCAQDTTTTPGRPPGHQHGPVFDRARSRAQPGRNRAWRRRQTACRGGIGVVAAADRRRDPARQQRTVVPGQPGRSGRVPGHTAGRRIGHHAQPSALRGPALTGDGSLLTCRGQLGGQSPATISS